MKSAVLLMLICLYSSQKISAVLLFPSFVLFRAITTGSEYVATQKHVVKTVHATKIVSSLSKKIVIVSNLKMTA